VAYRFDKSELGELAHWFGVNPDDLEGERHTDKALQFVLHLQRRGKIPQLIERLQQLRPNENWLLE
jgi:hypothetical protein